MAFSSEPDNKLLDLIYDAASEPQLWCSALTEIADRTGSQGGILFGQSVTARTVYFDYNGRLSEECNRAYKERHMHNAWSVGMEPQPVGRVVLSDEIIPLRALKSTPFYDEVLHPQDVAHNAMIALAAKEDFRAAFNLCRSARQGPLGGDQHRFLRGLLPHLRRAMLLGFRLDAYRALQHAEYHVLDRLADGVVLLDRQVRIIYANAAARAHGVRDGVLTLRSATVSASSPSHAQRLSELIRAAILGNPTGSMSLPRAKDGQLLTILVSSVRGKDIGRFADIDMPDVAVLLFIVDPLNRAGLPLAWIMDAFGLTAAEAKVAVAASSGVTIPEAAIKLGLTPNTIKTHLRKVFAKTGTSRQTELARLMASIGFIKGSGPE